MKITEQRLNQTLKELESGHDEELYKAFKFYFDREPELAMNIYIKEKYGVTYYEYVTNQKLADKIEKEWRDCLVREQTFFSEYCTLPLVV